MSNLVGATLLNRYHIESFVGRGGMAEVYQVWDAERATYLAMKLLREDLAQDRVFLRRFRREAETLARLQHPNIVRFYGLEQDSLAAFMLMDYIEGTSLRTEIFQSEGTPLPGQRIREVMRPVCSALHYAHSQGMIHCDVKPGNILIDQTGRVLVSDFGIARMTDAATATMVGAGTPAYMAPEQVLGHKPVPQTDIYALGVVLYETLTGGERPFTGEQAQTTGSTSEKVRWEQLNLKPPSPRKYDPDISPELEAVVLGCLAKEPEQRYPGLLDLLNALERAMGEVETAESSLAEAQPAPKTKVLAVDDAPMVPMARPPLSQEKGERKRTHGILVWLWLVAVALILVVLLGGVALSGIDLASIVLIGTPAAAVIEPAVTTTYTSAPTDTSTPVPTGTPTQTPTKTPTPTPTLTAREKVYILAESSVTHNDDWTPYIEEYNGTLMALVPAGCFQTGSEYGDADVWPAPEICFEEPFWIDVYEVTNEQYGSIGCKSASFNHDQPRNCVNWTSAKAHCESRGARLPTEVEWEYAARGPDRLVYPWGNTFVADNVVYDGNSDRHAWGVGSKPGGISWIGAYDLSGNVREWVDDGPGSYPMPEGGNYRVMMGGSWFESDSRLLRADSRIWAPPASWDKYIGFRCALSW